MEGFFFHAGFGLEPLTKKQRDSHGIFLAYVSPPIERPSIRSLMVHELSGWRVNHEDGKRHSMASHWLAIISVELAIAGLDVVPESTGS